MKKYTCPPFVMAMVWTLLSVFCFFSVGCGSVEEREIPVFVITAEAPGYSAERTEATITMPLERELSGLGVEVRSVSSAGRSVMTVFSGNATDSLLYGIRGCISRAVLPDGVAPPRLEHYIDPRCAMRYTLQSGVHTPAELRRWHETVMAEAFAQTPGVRQVFTVGGKREYQMIVPDLPLLKKYGVDLNALTDAVEGALFDTNLRLPGTVVAPGVWLKDVAQVNRLPCDEPASVAKDTDDGLLEGIVVFDGRQSAENMAVIFFSVLEKIRNGHPGVSVVPFYTGRAGGDGQIPGRQLRIAFPPGSDRAQKTAFCSETRALLGSVPGVKSVVSETGFSLNGDVTEERAATFFVVLDGATDVEATENALREKLRTAQRAAYRFLSTPDRDVPSVRYIRVSGLERMQCAQALRAVRDDLSTMEDVTGIYDEAGGESPETAYVIRPGEAVRYGLSLSDVMRAVETASAGKTWDMGRVPPVRMELLPGQAAQIGTYLLFKAGGKWISLSQISEKRVNSTPAVLRRENGQPYAELVFTAADAQAVRAVEERFKDPASRPASVPPEAVIKTGKAGD